MKLSRSTVQFFYSFSIIGFVLSALTHAATLLGRDPRERFPNIWGLHIGIFIACVPAFFAGRQLAGHRYREYWDIVLSRVSPTIRYTMYGLFGYALANFFVCLTALGFATPGKFQGKPALLDHGHLVRFLSAGEFQRIQSLDLRLFSGHWMAFYFAAFAILRAVLNSAEKPLSTADFSSAPRLG